MIIRKKVLFNFLALFIFLIIFFVYLNGNNYEEYNISILTIIGLTINILLLINNYRENNNMKSSYSLFLLLSIPFFYGQLFVRYVIGYIPSNTFDLSKLVSIDSEVKSILLIILSQLSMNFGYVFYKSKKSINKKYKESYGKSILIVGLILIIISIIPAFINYYQTMKACISLGYFGRNYVSLYGLSSIYSKLVPFFYIGLLCLSYGLKNKKSLSKVLLFFSIIFYGSQIFWGNRGMPIIMVICYIWFYHYYVEMFSKKKIILSTLIILFLVSTLNVIRYNRTNSLKDWIFEFDEKIVDDVFINNRPKKLINIIFKNSRIKSNVKTKHKNNNNNKNKINKNNK